MPRPLRPCWPRVRAQCRPAGGGGGRGGGVLFGWACLFVLETGCWWGCEFNMKDGTNHCVLRCFLAPPELWFYRETTRKGAIRFWGSPKKRHTHMLRLRSHMETEWDIVTQMYIYINMYTLIHQYVYIYIYICSGQSWQLFGYGLTGCGLHLFAHAAFLAAWLFAGSSIWGNLAMCEIKQVS